MNLSKTGFKLALVVCSILAGRIGYAQETEDQPAPQSQPPAPGAGEVQATAPPPQSVVETPAAPPQGDATQPQSTPVTEEFTAEQSAQTAPAPASAAPETAKKAGVEEIMIVGSRRPQDRSITESPVGVDIIKMDNLATPAGHLDINQLLQYVAPSFNSNKQSGADGADHIDPATLRGLGPDQTLVLINGKRRHQTSLINIYGSRGRGNTGTDLNTIPISAIERIEILRDGASAQYGSDAIAGVVNIVLKSNVEQFEGSVNAGFRNARSPGAKSAKNDNAIDGETVQVSGNYGVRVKEDGFINLTLDYLNQDRTLRPSDPAYDIYRRKFGDAAGTNFATVVNAEAPLSDHATFYSFGGLNFRHTEGYAFTRAADDNQNIPAIYPNGFDPLVTSNITDYSLSAGVRSQLAGWGVDVNNTYGINRFHYIIKNTLNASLLENSPTQFDAGGHQFSQNTTGLHFTRFFGNVLGGLNVAFGVEHRIDNYQIFAGEEGSYKNYGIVDFADPVTGELVPTDLLGRDPGARGFTGFQPSNEVDENRTNIAAYLDTELDIVKDVLMLGLAGRTEHYSDFGNTADGKVTSRWTMFNDDASNTMIALRGSISTGFRAPSLPQLYYNTIYTDVVSGESIDKIITENDSPLTHALGIAALKEEKSVNASVGITSRFDFVNLTIDGYYVKVRDRVVLTGSFKAEVPQFDVNGNAIVDANGEPVMGPDPVIGQTLTDLNVGAAQFFTNALDTETMGVDLILSSVFEFNEDHTLNAALSGNFNHMKDPKVKTNALLAGREDSYFGERDKKFLLASAPRMKASLALDYTFKMLNFHVRGTYFDKVVLVDWLDTDDVYKPRAIMDVAIGWDITDSLSLLVGADNVFNTYPTKQDTETETGGMWDSVQMGFSGAFYYAKAGFKY